MRDEIDFEAHRGHLRDVAFRMLGSLAEADDAVQEAWLRFHRADTGDVANPGGWLTTVVARVCLDMLRARKSRGEDDAPETLERQHAASDPEAEVALADSVGAALLVVLDLLDPAERLAFVLHDVFALPFEEIASIVDRTPDAARQLASRARRRVQGAPSGAATATGRQRKVVDAFLHAVRGGDIAGIVAVLDPEVLVDIEQPDGTRRRLRGATTWAKGAVAFSRSLLTAEAALVDGALGVVAARGGKLFRAVRFTFGVDGKIERAEIIAGRARLDALVISVLV